MEETQRNRLERILKSIEEEVKKAYDPKKSFGDPRFAEFDRRANDAREALKDIDDCPDCDSDGMVEGDCPTCGCEGYEVECEHENLVRE